MTIIPGRILPKYGSSIVNGTAMFSSGIVTSLVVQPWNNVPALDAAGWQALIVLILLGRALRMRFICRALRTSAACARA